MKTVKYTSIIILILGAVGMGAFAEEEYRIFTARDGRMIEGRIVEYNAVRNKLRIERRGDKSAWVELAVFSEKDRIYIKEWISASLFLAESNLKISFKKTNKGSSGSKKSKKETDKIGYEIKLQNRSKQPMNIAEIEYRYYVRNIRIGSGKDAERSEGGRLNAGTLKPSQTRVLNTSSLSLVTVYRDHVESTRDFYGSVTYDRSIVKVSEDKLRGIWVRIYGPEVDGQRLYRDVTYPKGLEEKAAWMRVSKNQGNQR